MPKVILAGAVIVNLVTEVGRTITVVEPITDVLIIVVVIW